MKMKILVVLCVLSLLLLAGCQAAENGNGTVDPVDPGVTEPQEPGDGLSETPDPVEPTEPTEPNPWPEPIYGETKEFTLSIEGMDEAVMMTETTLDFSHWGGAEKASPIIYIDRERYDCYAFEGEYNIVPQDSGEEPNAILHLYPIINASAAEAQAAIKDSISEYGWGEIRDEGTVQLDHHEALYVGTDAGNDYYFVAYEGGCFVISLWTTAEAAEGHGARMMAMLQTLQIP